MFKLTKVLKKTLLYRVLSIFTEAMIIYIWTGRVDITSGITVTCILVHTSLYYLVEKKFK